MTHKQKVAWEVYYITGPRRIVAYFWGPSQAHFRQKVIERATGEKTVRSKCGYKTLREILLKTFEIDATKYGIIQADRVIETAILEEVGAIAR